MRFLSALLFWIVNLCVIAWYYCRELGKRWRLRESAFRSAGHDAGLRGRADDLSHVAFLAQSKQVFDSMAADWSSAQLLTIQHWESAKRKCRECMKFAEVFDVADIEKRCKRLLGNKPRFNPLRTELYWCGLLLGAVVEFILNSSALEIEGQNERLTAVLAVILSLAFLFGVDRMGALKAHGKSIRFPAVTLTALIAGITLIRHDAVAAYMTSIQGSAPDLAKAPTDPRIFVFLFCGVQLLFFYFAYHWAVQHHDPLLAEYHHAKTAELSKRSCGARVDAIDDRLDKKAILWLSGFSEFQRLFDHRVMVFIEAAESHRRDGSMQFSQLLLEEPYIVTWSKGHLGNRQQALLPPAA